MRSVTIKTELRRLGTPAKAQSSARFFKTGKGEYGERDAFIGLTAPEQRVVAKKYRDMPLSEVEMLLHSKEHEFRLTALFILVGQFERGDQKSRKAMYDVYMSNTKWINNWDLVDASAHYIVGAYLLDRSRAPLMNLARSKSLWERRIAIVATFAFIRKGDVEDTLKIAEMLLIDTEDLIHKATGWMLREVLKSTASQKGILFLDVYHKTMPRTALRYAIERLSLSQRKVYMRK